MSYHAIDQYALSLPRSPKKGSSPTDDRMKTKPKRRFSVLRWLKRLVITAVLIVLVGGGWLGWKVYANAAKITGDKDPLQLLSVFTPSTLSETNGRVNVLLAGYSVDDPGHQGAELTDSIMVVSYDPSTKSATLISIPRDTWIDVPGFGYQKINAAYEDGEQENFSAAGYANGGMGLLEEVVQQNFGIQSDYYGLLDYTAFQDAVNAVGGVSVDIQSPDPRGLYDPNANLNLPNGDVTLDGQQALDLARARGDGAGSYGFPDSDFDRTEHQQQLLVALKTKASSASILSNPLKLSSLADAIGNNFTTNMSLGVMETLYADSRGVGTSNIQSVTLDDYNGQDLFTDYEAPDSEAALTPAAGFDNFSQIQTTIQSILGSTPST
jgi:LCP family protein required for cell wall assembly